MVKVKTFGMELRPLKAHNEIEELDRTVNDFIAANKVEKVMSVSDMPTTDDKGETIGIVRVLCYKVKH